MGSVKIVIVEGAIRPATVVVVVDGEVHEEAGAAI